MYFAIPVCVLGAIMLILCVLYKRYKKKRKTAWSKDFEDCNQVSFKGRMRNREIVGTERNHVLLKIQMYIIPLICTNLDKMQYIMVLFLLLIIIGMIITKDTIDERMFLRVNIRAIG